MTVIFDDKPQAPIEHRYAGVTVDAVDQAQRLVTVVAVPYEEPALVEYRQEMWHEVFERGSFDGIEKRPNRVRANRDHDKTRPVGKAMRFWPDRPEGLVAELRIGQTLLGDETLALAAEDMLSVSIGFGVLPSNQVLERRSMTRRIRVAYLDHIAFVQCPAYEQAQVLSVRDVRPDTGDPIITPSVDEFVDDPVWQWTRQRLSK